MSDRGMDELARIATERTLAGQPCAAVKLTGAPEGLLVDFDGDGQVTDTWSVPGSTRRIEACRVRASNGEAE